MNYEKLFTGVTQSEFFAIADNWYLRFHRLREAANSKSSEKYIRKALRLSNIMAERLYPMVSIAIKVTQPIPKFKPGTFTSGLVGEVGPEIIESKKL